MNYHDDISHIYTYLRRHWIQRSSHLTASTWSCCETVARWASDLSIRVYIRSCERLEMAGRCQYHSSIWRSWAAWFPARSKKPTAQNRTPWKRSSTTILSVLGFETNEKHIGGTNIIKMHQTISQFLRILRITQTWLGLSCRAFGWDKQSLVAFDWQWLAVANVKQ